MITTAAASRPLLYALGLPCTCLIDAIEYSVRILPRQATEIGV
jgi:hypothetical protein